MSRQKILLINLPSPPGMVVNREGVCGLGNKYPGAKGFLYPPHTLASVAAQLRQLGHRVKVVDGVASDCTNVAITGEIHAMRPEIVGIHLSYAALNWDMASTNFVTHGLSSTKVVVFGPIMQFEAELVRAQTLADAILIGEPEFLFPRVLDSLRDRPRNQKAAIYQAEKELEGKVDGDGFAEDLDGLAPPAWDLCGIRDGKVSVMASRGCDEGCAYCPYIVAQGRRFRWRSPKSVVEELEWAVRKKEGRRVIFRDPAFAAERQRVVGICELILSRGLKFVWECESRPEHFDPGLLGLMRRAGCEEVKVGLETVDGDLLTGLGRIRGRQETPAYLEHFRQLAEASRMIDLRLRVFAMFGLPGESQESVDETEAFVESLRPRAFNVKAFEMYPGLRLGLGKSILPSTGEGLLRLRDQIEGRAAVAQSGARNSSVSRWLGRIARLLRGSMRRIRVKEAPAR